jgi:antitoxin (DNA-binding transcriptional repressor) of toxin-antitoxin stability system
MTIDIRELPQRIDEAIAQSQAGIEVVIVDGDVLKAKLVPVDQIAPRERVLGLHPGAIEMAPDFDEYLGDEFWGLKD